MQIPIITLSLIMGSIFITEGILVFGKSFGLASRKTGFMLAGGAILQGLGLFFLLGMEYRPLLGLAVISNAVFILGQLVVCAGVRRVFLKKPAYGLLVPLFLGFLVAYYSFMFWHNSIPARTAVISIAMFLVSLFIFVELVRGAGTHASGHVKYLALVFLVYTLFNLVRTIIALLNLGQNNYESQKDMLVFVYVFPVLLSIFWTDGFLHVLKQGTSPSPDSSGKPDAAVDEQKTTQEEASPLDALGATLSTRELEILKLLMQGCTYDRIAEQCFISKNTVKTHLKNMYAKLGVHNKVELINLVRRTAVQ